MSARCEIQHRRGGTGVQVTSGSAVSNGTSVIYSSFYGPPWARAPSRRRGALLSPSLHSKEATSSDANILVTFSFTPNCYKLLRKAPTAILSRPQLSSRWRALSGAAPLAYCPDTHPEVTNTGEQKEMQAPCGWNLSRSDPQVGKAERHEK